MSVPETRALRKIALICAVADAAAVRGIAQRLRADGVMPWLAVDELPTDRNAPQELLRALRHTGAAIICLSRRSQTSNHQLDPLLETAIELLNLFPDDRRLTVALRLAQCPLPTNLRPTITLDLFGVQHYVQLLNTVRDHQANLSTAARPALTPPPPAAPLPLLRLQGHVIHPDLEEQGHLRRFGSGVARGLELIDERHALVISGSGARLIDLDDGRSIWEIDTPTRSFALSRQGRLLALAGVRQITIWNLAEQRIQNICRGHDGPIEALAFAPDERLLISAGADRTIKLWRSGTEQLVQVAPIASIPAHSDQIQALAFAPDGRYFASGSADRTIRIWRMLDRGLMQTLSGSGGGIEALSFHPDGTHLASGSRDRQARLWEIRNGRCIHTFEAHNGAVESLRFSPDGTTLLTGAGDHEAQLWHYPDGTLLRHLSGNQVPISAVAFDPSGRIPATLAEDGRLLVWEEPDATPTVDLRPLNGSVGTLIFSADGSLLAIGYSDGEVLVAAATAPLPPRSRRFEYRGRVESIAFTATGRLISSAGDGIIRLCRFDADETSILLRIHGTRTNTVIAPDGRWLAAADAERTVQLWRLHTDTKTPGGSFWRVLRGMQGRPTLLRISANANTIAVYSDDGTIRVWHTNDLERDQEQPVFTVTGPIGRIRSLALADNGERLAAGSDEGKIAIWELSNEQPITILPTQERAISALAFTPDSRGIAAGTSDGRCFIWRIPRRHTRQRSNAGPTILHGHAGSITRLAYSPSDALLASGSSDGTVRLWRIDDGAKTTRR